MINTSQYSSPFGTVNLAEMGGELILSEFNSTLFTKHLKELKKLYSCEHTELETTVIRRGKKELSSYFTGKLNCFKTPLKLHGTDFQKQVWKALIDIPFGTTLSYKKQSEKLGNPLAIRAIANANGKNKISVFIPCHRVIGSDGSLTGYAGGLTIKKQLLELESNQITLF